jgi:hypothetical protein
MLADLGLTDAQLEEVRDICDILAEIVIDDWIKKHNLEI